MPFLLAAVAALGVILGSLGTRWWLARVAAAASSLSQRGGALDEAPASAAEQVLAGFDFGVVTFDAALRACYANDKAAQLLETHGAGLAGRSAAAVLRDHE